MAFAAFDGSRLAAGLTGRLDRFAGVTSKALRFVNGAAVLSVAPRSFPHCRPRRIPGGGGMGKLGFEEQQHGRHKDTWHFAALFEKVNGWSAVS